VGCYVLGAFALTYRLWADPAGQMVAGNAGDINLFSWFMRDVATAVSHGHLPALVTTGLNAPQGINLMWNTSELLPGVVLAPVTLLAGPQTSLNVLLTVGFAGSAASLFLVLRRWDVSVIPAAIGGAVYGFSPALITSGIGHFQLEFAVLPPLIIHMVLRLVTGRGHALRTGLYLGLLTAAQVTDLVQRQDEGVHAAATVGLRVPTWAAAPPGRPDPELAGTINLIVALPVPLTDAALVNAVATATEAKVQAVLDAGFAGTGTATDAICVAAPAHIQDREEEFAGPRSVWGARIARAVHAAVQAGAAGYAATLNGRMQ